MKNTNITFNELRELLLELGFRETPQKTRLRFEHPAAGTILLLRLYTVKKKSAPVICCGTSAAGR